MRTLNNTGLIRVEKHQWPAVKKALLSKGYKLRPTDGRNNPPVMWNKELTMCVGGYNKMDRCYYLDEWTRPDLPRPVGRPHKDDPWVDIGGEG